MAMMKSPLNLGSPLHRVLWDRSCTTASSATRFRLDDAHLQHKVVGVPLRHINPQHIIKQQVVTIEWGQPRMSQSRGADHDFMQLSYFGINAVVFGFGLNSYCCYLSLKCNTVSLRHLAGNSDPAVKE